MFTRRAPIPRISGGGGCCWGLGAVPPSVQAVALALHLDDVGVGEEAAEDRRRRGDIPEKLAPVLCGAIGRDERRGRLVSANADFQEVLGGRRTKPLHLEILEDEQVDARQALAGGFGEACGRSNVLRMRAR